MINAIQKQCVVFIVGWVFFKPDMKFNYPLALVYWYISMCNGSPERSKRQLKSMKSNERWEEGAALFPSEICLSSQHPSLRTKYSICLLG